MNVDVLSEVVIERPVDQMPAYATDKQILETT